MTCISEIIQVRCWFDLDDVLFVVKYRVINVGQDRLKRLDYFTMHAFAVLRSILKEQHARPSLL